MDKNNEDALSKMKHVPIAILIMRRAGLRYVASKLGVSPQAVSNWARNGMPIKSNVSENYKYWELLSKIGKEVGVNASPDKIMSDSKKIAKLL